MADSKQTNLLRKAVTGNSTIHADNPDSTRTRTEGSCRRTPTMPCLSPESPSKSPRNANRLPSPALKASAVTVDEPAVEAPGNQEVDAVLAPGCRWPLS